mmetsp:Transcript_80518/g.232704  ORF Transcript_80518/g.232704 Transcript_80518/m.232704 type:complete len:228 (+) Transcript_80518:838-1521(+)
MRGGGPAGPGALSVRLVQAVVGARMAARLDHRPRRRRALRERRHPGSLAQVMPGLPRAIGAIAGGVARDLADDDSGLVREGVGRVEGERGLLRAPMPWDPGLGSRLGTARRDVLHGASVARGARGSRRGRCCLCALAPRGGVHRSSARAVFQRPGFLPRRVRRAAGGPRVRFRPCRGFLPSPQPPGQVAGRMALRPSPHRRRAPRAPRRMCARPRFCPWMRIRPNWK